jgi:PAS domain S-box-containing protein
MKKSTDTFNQEKKPETATKSGKLRQAAELLLSKKKKSSESTVPESDTSKIIHELEVHQMELEMQNDELKQARDKAERAEKKYTELYDFAPSGYLTLTKEGEIIDLNISAERLLGKDRSLLIKSSLGFFISLDTRALYNRFLQRIFKTKLKETCELKLETDDDIIKYVLVNGIISNVDEKCLVILIDITKRKEAEYKLIKAKKKAEENERLKSSFLANMSHEIRTPMNGILGFTELLKNLNLNGEEQQSYIGIIKKSGARLLSIINDIINISKIESQQIEVSLSETNVNEQVEYIYHFFKLEAEQKKLHISFNNELPSENAFIRTDREKVYAVLTNLVKNAIKFTQTGSVELGYTKKKGFFEFYVKDSGPGITEGQQEIIFGRFMQGTKDLTRIYEGAGLGLSISKAYIEMLGGKIRVENNTDKKGDTTGATFLFSIPALPLKESDYFIQDDKTEKTTKNETRNLNILVVEDDKISKMIITKMVEELSRKILKATTGVEAVELCRKNPDIDLVLMDINMPEMDGYEATQKIREFNKDVIIIAQTAYALIGDREKSIEAGCNDYISKPINKTDLKIMISNYFSESTKIQTTSKKLKS